MTCLPPLATGALRSLHRALAALVSSCLLLGAGEAQGQASLMVYDFELGPDPVANVDQVRALGFSGIVTRCSFPQDLPKLQQYSNHVATIQDFQLLAYVNYDFQDTDSASVWRDALPLLASHGAPLWVIVKNAPSPAAVHLLLLRMAQDSQAAGVRTVLYPHWDTDVESAAEAAAVIAQVGHPNLRNSLHTCHEIRAGNQYALPSVVAAHAPATQLVTIAGALEDAYAGSPPVRGYPWDDAIRPLDSGAFSLTPYLQALEDAGYNGPVVLHTFGVTDQPGHLSRSLAAWGKYQAQVN